MVEFLRDPERFERLGARVPKGILLYGPPGTGKTLMAKAVASESGANFYSRAPRRSSRCSRASARPASASSSQEARKNAPAIIFIDELDAVGAARTGHGFNREQDQTLNQLLVELDGFDASERVVVMGASNRLQDLDPALLRPGRFDRQMLVSPPDLAGREAILNVHTRGKPLAADVDLHADREADRRADRRRPREHLQRGRDLRRPQGASVPPPRRVRRRDGARRRRPAAAPHRDREGEADPRVPRGGHAVDVAPDRRLPARAEGDDRRARPGARLHAQPSRRGPLPPHEGRARRPDEGLSRAAAPPSRSCSAA